LGVRTTVTHLGAAVEVGARGTFVGLFAGLSALAELGAAVVDREQEAELFAGANLRIGTFRALVSNGTTLCISTLEAETAATDSNKVAITFIFIH
jgi:hypothetical protein